VKTKLEAGMWLDLLTRDEVAAVLKGWQAELVRGVTFRTLPLRTDQAGGFWTMPPAAPAAGFVWSLTRIAVAGNAIVGANDAFSVYFDEIAPSQIIGSGFIRQTTWDPGVLVVNGPRQIIVTGAATGVAGTDVFAALSVVELPVQLAWQLI